MNILTESKKYQLESYIKCIKDAYNAAGIAVSVIDRDYNVLYEEYFGYRDVEKRLPVDGDTVFGIASITKSFTCLALMQLEEKGYVNTDEPVVFYIPEFKNQGQDVIKIQHFMTHSAGYYPLSRIRISEVAKETGEDKNKCDYAYNVKIAEAGAGKILERLNSQKEYIGRPGEYFSYCNDGYGILAEIIRRYGLEKTYAEYVNKHILKPLGMTRSTLEFNKLKTDDNVSLLYYNKNGKLTCEKDCYNYHFALLGGGGMKSTINDMKKYVAMYLNKGKSFDGQIILDKYRINEMCKPRIKFRPRTFYGYGLYTETVDNISTVRHYGSLPGVSSVMIWSEELEIGAVVLCNTSDVPVENIGKAVIRAFNQKGTEVNIDDYNDLKPDKNMINNIIGRYHADEGPDIVIYKNNDKLKISIEKEKYTLHMVEKHLGIIYKPYQYEPVMLLEDEKNKIFAVRYNDRIIPKIQGEN